MHGKQFGSWAGTGERINTIKVFSAPDTNDVWKKVIILPPVGKMPQPNLAQLQKNMQQEMQNYFSEPVFTLNEDGGRAKDLNEDNITLTADQFDCQEVGRIGRLYGGSHVMCVLVRQFRAYPPQILNLHIALVETTSNRAVAELTANFDASQQVVVLAADEYLQSRLARNYDLQSLDMLLGSPSEYCTFVSAQCCRALAESLRNNKDKINKGDMENKRFKKPTDSTDNKM